MYTLGGEQKLVITNEPGLYRLVFLSRKPEAERFKTWVFTQVLPQIRKTGSYGVSHMSMNAINTFIKESVPRINFLTGENDRLKQMNRLYREAENLRKQLAKKNTTLSKYEKREILMPAKTSPVSKIAQYTGRSATTIRKVIKGGAV